MTTLAKVMFSILAGLFLALVIFHSCGCGRMITPPLRDGVILEGCMLNKRVYEDPELSQEEKELRYKMTFNNRIMVGGPGQCPEVGR